MYLTLIGIPIRARWRINLRTVIQKPLIIDGFVVNRGSIGANKCTCMIKIITGIYRGRMRTDKVNRNENTVPIVT